MKKALCVFVLCTLLSAASFAAVVPAYSPKFGEAMAAITIQKAAGRGFVAGDPRTAATMTAVSTVLTTAAAGVAASAGLPLWAGLGLSIGAGIAINLAVDGVSKWLFGSDGKVTNPDSGQTTAPMSGHFGWTGANGFYGAIWSSSPQEIVNFEAIYSTGPGGYVGDCQTIESGTRFNCIQYTASGTWTGGVDAYYREMSAANYSEMSSQAPCPGVWKANGYGCQGSTLPSAPAAPKNPVDAVADIPETEMTKPVNPKILADAINDAWSRAAAAPGFQGLPYSVADPVTEADVNTWRAANPTSYPTVGNALSPAVDPTTSAVPYAPAAGTSAGTTTGTNTAPAGTVQVNLGTDPAIGFPTLEMPPTALEILNPITSLFGGQSGLKSFVVPDHSAECPKPSIELFNKHLVLDGHCTLLETVRPTLYAVMAFVWAMIAVLIILAA